MRAGRPPNRPPPSRRRRWRCSGWTAATVAGTVEQRSPISAESHISPRRRSRAVLAYTKLQAPSIRSGLVPRGRLVSAITAVPGAKLTLVSAPAGSGKTTLLAEWSASRGERRPFAWLSLDASDNDPVRFYEGVIAALRLVVPGVGEQALSALAGPTSLTDVALPSLVNELGVRDQPLVLVLDDYHLVVNPTIHESLDFLLEHLPATLQLAIASRTEPPLGLARLRVRGELVEINAPELRFTRKEATSLLNELGGLVRHELARTEPALVPELHRRASAWFRDHGSASEAIRHSTAAGDVRQASELIRHHWYEYLQRGRIETVAGWLAALGDDAVERDAGLCLTKAWIAVNTGRLGDVADWIEAAERAHASDGGGDRAMIESGVAALREIYRYMDGGVEDAVEAGRRSVERGETPWRPVGCPVLGIALFWSGRADEAASELAASAETARSAGNHLAVIHASGGLAALSAERGDIGAAERGATGALDLAQERSLTEHWATTMARVARARVLEHEGRISEAGDAIERGVELSRRGVAAVEIAYALLAKAEALQLQGDREGATEV